jgi:4-hydroxybenzoate polyprenyltransferase
VSKTTLKQTFFKYARILLSISRPGLWLIPSLVYLLGYFVSGAKISFLGFFEAFLLTFPFGVIVYGINDIYDYETDKLNSRKTSDNRISLDPTWGGILKKIYHRFVLISTIVASWVMVVVSFITLNPLNIASTLILLIFTYAYSTPPFRFKNTPFMDSFSNVFIYFLGPFLMGYSFGGDILSISPHIWAICFSAFATHLASAGIDYYADKEAGIQSTAVFLGLRKTVFVCLVLFSITLYFWFGRFFELDVLLIISLGFSVFFLFYPNIRDGLNLAKRYGKYFLILLMVCFMSVLIRRILL